MLCLKLTHQIDFSMSYGVGRPFESVKSLTEYTIQIGETVGNCTQDSYTNYAAERMQISV